MSVCINSSLGYCPTQCPAIDNKGRIFFREFVYQTSFANGSKNCLFIYPFIDIALLAHVARLFLLFFRNKEGRWKKAGKPPHKLQIRKGGLHVMASRGFVDYILHNQVAKDLIQWLKKTIIPDEFFFSTLNHNPQLRVPGSSKGMVRAEPCG